MQESGWAEGQHVRMQTKMLVQEGQAHQQVLYSSVARLTPREVAFFEVEQLSLLAHCLEEGLVAESLQKETLLERTLFF